ncbi:MAG: gamma carbonic anhydrase family protein [Phycisphaeraceae bacterium]|nr:gamma carbonic anhydrase family protein [Phycisphaeraceae bacterium]
MSIQCINGAYVADTARIVGEVTLGRDCNVWYGVSMRGDVAAIEIGEQTSIQDNTVVHCDKGFPNRIGNAVIVGHGAICHGVLVDDGSMIGMGAILLAGTRVGPGSIVAAGALLAPGTEVPAGMVAMGSPAKIVRPVNEREKQYLLDIPARYVEMARLHAKGKDRRVLPWPPGP